MCAKRRLACAPPTRTDWKDFHVNDTSGTHDSCLRHRDCRVAGAPFHEHRIRHCEFHVSGGRNCIRAMNPGFVIARSLSDVAIHEQHRFARMDCRAALAMTAGFFVDFRGGSLRGRRPCHSTSATARHHGSPRCARGDESTGSNYAWIAASLCSSHEEIVVKTMS